MKATKTHLKVVLAVGAFFIANQHLGWIDTSLPIEIIALVIGTIAFCTTNSENKSTYTFFKKGGRSNNNVVGNDDNYFINDTQHHHHHDHDHDGDSND